MDNAISAHAKSCQNDFTNKNMGTISFRGLWPVTLFLHFLIIINDICKAPGQFTDDIKPCNIMIHFDIFPVFFQINHPHPEIPDCDLEIESEVVAWVTNIKLFRYVEKWLYVL